MTPSMFRAGYKAAALFLAALAWLKARDLAEIALGGCVGFLVAAAFFTVIMRQTVDVVNARAIENAQLQVADALTEANRFRASLICKGIPINGVCPVWEPRP